MSVPAQPASASAPAVEALRERRVPAHPPRVERSLFPLSKSEAWLLEADADPVFRWHDAARGLRLAAWGQAAALRVDGGGRWERARRWCSSIFERMRGDGLERLPAVLAAFAFDGGRQPPNGLWRGWPRGWVWVPRVLAYQWPAADPPAGLLVHGSPVAARWSANDHGEGRCGYRRLDGERERCAYQNHVRAIVNAVRDGRLEKVVAARAAELAAPPGARFDGAATAKRLGRGSADGILFSLEHSREAFVGCTPELLARAESGVLETCALAGTAPAAAPASELHSEKNLREHRLVVDAIAASLARLCEDVAAEPLRATAAGPVHHLSATLRGRLAAGTGLLDAAALLHPTPALGGTPRDAALAWLAEHERLDRGLYGGPIGWLAPSGDGVLAVAIRSALLRGDRATAFAGAGIVAGSEPEAEWHETESKLATVLAGLSIVERRAAP